MQMINGADTAWVLVSFALVLLMTPALGLFYGGLVREKNALNTLLHSLILLGAVSLQWAVIGYSLAFAPDALHGFVGGLDHAFLAGVGAEPNLTYAPTVPHSAFMLYQMAFAIITPALISGAFAERKRFSAFLLFSLLWATLVYDPVAHWVWGDGGWLRSLGALDFAGGTVVHISSGVSALVAALVLGKRRDGEGSEPHNAVITLLGAALLWFGWLGFNGGSALSAGALAAHAVVTTHLAASAGAVSWVASHYLRTRRVSVLGVGLGGVAGLVGITPAAGFVTFLSAIAIGTLAGIVCSWAVSRLRTRVDDTLDVFGVHGVGGILGALATGALATQAVNQAGSDGGIHLLGVQAVAVVCTALYSGGMTLAILYIVRLFTSLRVSDDAEREGLDSAQHGESAYRIG